LEKIGEETFQMKENVRNPTMKVQSAILPPNAHRFCLSDAPKVLEYPRTLYMDPGPLKLKIAPRAAVRAQEAARRHGTTVQLDRYLPARNSDV